MYGVEWGQTQTAMNRLHKVKHEMLFPYLYLHMEVNDLRLDGGSKAQKVNSMYSKEAVVRHSSANVSQ